MHPSGYGGHGGYYSGSPAVSYANQVAYSGYGGYGHGLGGYGGHGLGYGGLGGAGGYYGHH